MSYHPWLRIGRKERQLDRRLGREEDRLQSIEERLTRLGEDTAKQNAEVVKAIAERFTTSLQETSVVPNDRLEKIEADLDTLEEGTGSLDKTLKTDLSSIRDLLLEIRKETAGTESRLDELEKKVEFIRGKAIETCRYASEAVWGEIFNQAITGSAWLGDRSFSPGRWAIGYQYLYVLYRILDEVKPQNILELGLGQSTKMISQYAAAFPDVRHRVVEHDPEWISFFARNYDLPSNTEIIRLDREFVPYKEAEKVRVFKGFRETFGGEKFDFISIDAPFGGDMKQYARIDVLGLIPECLSDDFIIMIDDCERSGEAHTVAEMEARMKASGIAYAEGRYSGKKDCVTLAAKSIKFVCSM